MVSTEGLGIDPRRLGQAVRGDSLKARNELLNPGDVLTVRIRRSDASDPSVSRIAEYRVPYQKRMRVLDTLNHIAEHDASDLAYRWYCGSKMCGSCGVRLNGREVLACWEAALPDMTIEPLRNLPVIRDLVVDRNPFEERVAELEPWIRRTEPYPGFPESLSHREMKDASMALDCIGCMCCYSACPVIGLGQLTDFAGPAPLVQLAQTALDPREDQEKVKRALASAGIFNCISCYKCEEVCPAHILIVSRVIEPLKAKAARLLPESAVHARVLRAIIARRGTVNPGALILGVQGLRALDRWRRILGLLARGKIKPTETVLGWLVRPKNERARAARRILDREAQCPGREVRCHQERREGISRSAEAEE